MRWLKSILLKLKSLLGIKLNFTLNDFDDIAWDLSSDNIHTIIQDAYTIYVVFKKGGDYKTFPNTAKNRENLPSIRLAQELKHIG